MSFPGECFRRKSQNEEDTIHSSNRGSLVPFIHKVTDSLSLKSHGKKISRSTQQTSHRRNTGPYSRKREVQVTGQFGVE